MKMMWCGFSNKSYPKLQESVQLITKPVDGLSVLERLQRKKTESAVTRKYCHATIGKKANKNSAHFISSFYFTQRFSVCNSRFFSTSFCIKHISKYNKPAEKTGNKIT